MYTFRVTKYDPARRDHRGVYTDADEWTDASQVGTVCGGVVLTPKGYLAVENRYVRAAEDFVREAGVPHLRATCVSGRFGEDPEAPPELDLTAEECDALPTLDDEIVGLDDLATVVRAVLRNRMWCKLEVDGRSYLHFGWDFYMYVGTHVSGSKASERAERDGLYVEHFESPYGRQENIRYVPRLTVFPKSEADDVVDVDLPDLTISELRHAFGYSGEHPLFGRFDITPHGAAALATLCGVAFDLERNDYILATDET